MALLFWDGLDNYSSKTEFQQNRTELNHGSGSAWDVALTSGRYGGVAYWWNDPGSLENGPASWSNTTSVTDVWVGRALYNRSQHLNLIGGVSVDVAPVAYTSANNFDTTVIVDFDGTIKLYRGWHGAGNLIANTGPGVLPAFQYRYVEMRFKTDATNGIVEVWVDNSRVLNYTGNTKNTSAAVSNSIKSVIVCGTGITSGSGCYVDDMYVLDTTGSNHANTRLGDLRIATVLVNGDAGLNQLVTQNNSAQHWIALDDSLPGVNTSDYVTGSSLNNNATEFYTHAAPPSLPNVIHAVMVQTTASKSDSGNGYFHNALSIGGVQYNTSTQSLSTSWVTYKNDWTVSPASSARWTYGEFANANIGFVIDTF